MRLLGSSGGAGEAPLLLAAGQWTEARLGGAGPRAARPRGGRKERELECTVAVWSLRRPAGGRSSEPELLQTFRARRRVPEAWREEEEEHLGPRGQDERSGGSSWMEVALLSETPPPPPPAPSRLVPHSGAAARSCTNGPRWASPSS